MHVVDNLSQQGWQHHQAIVSKLPNVEACQCALLAGLHMLKASCAAVYCSALLVVLPSLPCTAGKLL